MKNKIIVFTLTIAVCLGIKLYEPEVEGIKDFTLNSPEGAVSLTDYRGKIVLLYFGFLSCPEACPTTLSGISSAFKKLKKEDLEKIHLLFITLDPERDKLDDMKDYLAYFHPNMTALSGDMDVINRVAKFYHAKYRRIELGEGMGYTIDHSLNLLILNRKGDVIENLSNGHNSNQVLERIEHALKESV